MIYILERREYLVRWNIKMKGHGNLRPRRPNYHNQWTKLQKYHNCSANGRQTAQTLTPSASVSPLHFKSGAYPPHSSLSSASFLPSPSPARARRWISPPAPPNPSSDPRRRSQSPPLPSLRWTSALRASPRPGGSPNRRPRRRRCPRRTHPPSDAPAASSKLPQRQLQRCP